MELQSLRAVKSQEFFFFQELSRVPEQASNSSALLHLCSWLKATAEIRQIPTAEINPLSQV